MSYRQRSEGHVTNFESLRDAVAKHGSSQWYEIAMKLGLNDKDIKSEAWNKVGSGARLLSLIERNRMRVGASKTAEDLLKVCSQISTPIKAAVQDELEERGRENQLASELPTLTGSAADYVLVKEAVVKHGSNQWYTIGLKLGLNHNEMSAITYDKPNPARKLLSIINTKKAEVTATIMAENLLRVCSQILTPINKIVQEELERKDDRNELAREALRFTENVTDFDTIRKAVAKHISSHWYEIGVELGLDKEEIESVTFDKPSHAGKLLAVIEEKRMAVGTRTTANKLLTACRQISLDVTEAVEEELEKRDADNQFPLELMNISGDAVTEFKSLRDAVVKCGSHQWYEIGLELGLKNHVIQSEAWDKSTSCSKLLALIEVKRKATGTRKTSEYLWRVCHQLPTPIDEDVQEELQIRDGENQLSGEPPNLAANVSTNFKSIIDAVLRHGSSQWYEIGIMLGKTHDEISLSTCDINSPSGKLSTLILRTKSEIGTRGTAEVLLTLCHRLPIPIHGAVQDELMN